MDAQDKEIFIEQISALLDDEDAVVIIAVESRSKVGMTFNGHTQAVSHLIAQLNAQHYEILRTGAKNIKFLGGVEPGNLN